MDSKQPNLFIANRNYKQSWFLTFTENSTEKMYMTDGYRSQFSSFFYLWFYFLVYWCYFSLSYISPGLHILSSFFLVLCKFFNSAFSSLVIIQLYIIFWELNSLQSCSALECVGIFLPSLVLHLYLSKSLAYFIGSIFLTSIFLNSYTETSLSNLISGMVINISIFFAIEKDNRDLWHLYSSYKKSDSVFQNLWLNSPRANFILDSQGYVIHKNKAAEAVLKQKLSHDALMQPNINLEPVINLKRFHSLLEKTLKGEEVEEELLNHKKLRTINKESLASLGYLLKGSSIYWYSTNCSWIILTDLSISRAKKVMIIESLKQVEDILWQSYKEITELYRNEEELIPEIFELFCKLCQSARDIIILERRFFDKPDPRFEHFDAHSELMTLIETFYQKASNTNLSLLYTKEQGVPNSVIGDKILHNEVIYSIMNLITENACPGSDAYIFLQVSVNFI